MENENLVKIILEWTDPDGEQMSESVWAEGISVDTFRINNVPFYAYGISYDDVVSAKIKDDIFVFDKIIKRGGHSTFRVFFAKKDSSDQEHLIEDLNKLGATVERATEQLVAIDTPPDANVQSIVKLLKEGENREIWSYEEGFIFS